MKAPDKIFLHGYEFDDNPCKTWEREPKTKGLRGYKVKHTEYINKNLLIGWLNEMMEQVIIGPNAYDMGEENGKLEVLKALLVKLNSL